MKIKIFEIKSKNNKVYIELLEQYKVNPEIKELLHESIIDPEMVLMGDMRLITVLPRVINMKGIKVYLVKDTDSNTFLWVICKFDDNEELSMFPLKKEQSEELQLEVKKILVKNRLLRK